MKCERILSTIKKYSGAEVFTHPPEVSHPNFAELTKDYVDLSVVERKLRNGDYATSHEFVTDMRKIWERNLKLRKDSKEIQSKAKELSLVFENLIKELDNTPKQPANEVS